MNRKAAELIVVGDVILPPQREVSLWMRRALRERGLADSALHLTVTEVREGLADAGGRWVVVTSLYSPEWAGEGVKRGPFRFKARPKTSWLVVENAPPRLGPDLVCPDGPACDAQECRAERARQGFLAA